ncbi:unnamed protein product [Leptidea sinapis]|uniref:Uncharacterized protein n=1 Tax=Leptidea sinapis TaxID=189913 RepID=A0A5E4QQX5_9NEOP|nr:unnamed protein product [Leptidea sinapis]
MVEIAGGRHILVELRSADTSPRCAGGFLAHATQIEDLKLNVSDRASAECFRGMGFSSRHVVVARWRCSTCCSRHPRRPRSSCSAGPGSTFSTPHQSLPARR